MVSSIYSQYIAAIATLKQTKEVFTLLTFKPCNTIFFIVKLAATE